MNTYFDDLIADLRKITLMTNDEITEFVESNTISYVQLKYFYLKSGRLPNVDECNILYNHGIDFYEKLDLLGIQGAKSGEAMREMFLKLEDEAILKGEIK